MASTSFWIDPVLDLSVVFLHAASRPSSSYPARRNSRPSSTEPMDMKRYPLDPNKRAAPMPRPNGRNLTFLNDKRVPGRFDDYNANVGNLERDPPLTGSGPRSWKYFRRKSKRALHEPVLWRSVRCPSDGAPGAMLNFTDPDHEARGQANLW